MNDDLLERINKEFDVQNRVLAHQELLSIQLKHVMANSEYNLNNTRYAILKLANGDLKEVSKLTKAAKIDFRDVIMWAAQETKK